MEIDADMNLQRRLWVAQRVGWFIIGMAILAAVAGVFGTGHVSRASARSAGLQVEYERFGRLQQPMKLRLVVSEARHGIALSRDYFDSLHIEQITPQPSEVEAAGPWLIYRFAGSGPLAISFDLKAEEFGSLRGAARTADGNGVAFFQFIYP
jgi:hypothetical protein